MDEAVLPEVAIRQAKQTSQSNSLEYLLGLVAHIVADRHSSLALSEVRYT